MGVNSPRRWGFSVVRAETLPWGGTVIRARRDAGCSDGASSSASRRRSRRDPGLVTRQTTSAVPPSGTMPGSSRSTPTVDGRTATSQSTRNATNRAPHTSQRVVRGQGEASTTIDAAAATIASRAVGTGITPRRSSA